MTTSGSMLNARRFNKMLAALAQTSERLATSSPEAALHSIIEILKNAHPTLRLAIIFSTPIIMLRTALRKNSMILKACTELRRYITSKLMSQVKVSAGHPLQRQVMAYLVENGLKDARTLALINPQAEKSKRLQRLEDPYYEMRGRGMKSKPVDDAKKQDELVYVPDVGGYVFYFGGYRFRFDKRTETKSEQDDHTYRIEAKEKDTITISCLSLWAGVEPIQRFLNHVKTSAAESEESTTKIFRPSTPGTGMAWDEGISRPSRKLGAVTLDAHISEPLIKDIQDYLDPRTKHFYISNGIPYRKGYLLYGPPGTGKTSFAQALAGEYGLNVYFLGLSDTTMTDKRLEELFECLPSKCIVLLEDIDSAGIQRENMQAGKPKSGKKKKRHSNRIPPHLAAAAAAMMNGGYAGDDGYDDDDEQLSQGSQRSATRSVTLSGLLNVLDGVGAAEGRIVLMTSNLPDSLDKALVRAGRIDKKILFGYASHEVATKLFTRIFSKSRDQLLDGEKPFENIPELAKQFADQIPESTITPAEIQGHLLSYRTDPNAAVGAAAGFVANILAEKLQGTNVANFDPEAVGGRAPEPTESETDLASSGSSALFMSGGLRARSYADSEHGGEARVTPATSLGSISGPSAVMSAARDSSDVGVDAGDEGQKTIDQILTDFGAAPAA